ncbi:T9SS type B sorting domain-containing protein [Maribacter algicola]|uniref:T9SS type B sorting domain-containing protein n=1 Tax=Meishania litoralis TaxID=3434685 RepID=A0ACC7LFH8_9FLAO
MKRIVAVLLVHFFLGVAQALAQVSPDCGNAIPICNNTPVNGGTNGFGVDDFNGSTMTGCLEETLSGAIESNSAWYRFKTGESGQLGFNIAIDSSEDWDFALYKSDDCNDLGEPIRCNFFDNQDENTFIGVGQDPTGDTANVQYEAWLNVAPGEEYYLLINNFSNNNSGFSIQFSGSIFAAFPYTALDCSIINNLLGPPISACEGDAIALDATTTNASIYNWFSDTGNGFVPIPGENNAILNVSASALYRVEVVTPTGNIYSDVQVSFSEVPMTYPVSDDASCSESIAYDLSQKDVEALGGQSMDEYLVSYHESQIDANNGVNSLAQQYETGFGSKTIYVRVTSMMNPKCFDASVSFQLTALETPSVDFPLEAYLCMDNGNVTIGEIQPNANYNYSWDSGETTSSIVVSQAGNYTLTISNSQGGLYCSNEALINVVESKPPQIKDVIIDDLQNNNTVKVLVENSDVNLEYRMDDEPYQEGNTWYNVLPGAHTITVNDPMGCGEVTENIVVVGFPKYFTPNGDVSNADWQIQGLSNLDNPTVSIYDRYGKLLKQLTDENAGWDGTFNGIDMPSSDYWFKLTYDDVDGQRITAKYVNNHFALKR